LNWSRTQYFLVLNLGVVVLAAGVLQVGDRDLDGLAAGLFLAGLVSCVLSALAHQVAHGYFRATRDHKAAVEERLGLADLALTTTPGMGGAARRWGSVTTLVRSMLLVLAIVDLGGLVISGTGSFGGT
jgi:hypothetical protein